MITMITRRTAANGLETWMEISNKKLLRKALKSHPEVNSIPKLAAACGTSVSLIGFLLSEGRSGRKTCPVWLAEKISAALDWDIDLLFNCREQDRAA